MATVSTMADRLLEVRRNLPPTCQLLAVSKGHPAAAIREAVALGQRSFGESRLQEAQAKQLELADLPPLDWHFIGRLQANKVRGVLQHFGTIHSLDSLPLAERLRRIAQEEDLSPVVFAQVKLLSDPGKTGFDPDALRQLWPTLAGMAPLQMRGLMTIPPQGLESKDRLALFQRCADLAREFQLPELSMGMSGDWQEAVKAGSTWIRLGSTLFGERAVLGS